MSAVKSHEIQEFILASNAFMQGHSIPREYTCEGFNKAPILFWQGVPRGARSLMLICEATDGIVHWIVFNIPIDRKNIGPALERKKEVSDGTSQGRNSFKRIGYDGPCYTQGLVKEYIFKLYALDTMLDVKPGATKEQLLEATENKSIASAYLSGFYQNTKN